ncbi:hypothetical protein [Streptosporangium carneum]|uniref:Uncharacterized protein n=1 Tax=Streptosporangium carneum TaxID=47481 RepID=A0A9W6I5S7_9ACTN|nr:hypothetical protein [Streptosporangium carneum]GLK11479.1 hypothetical protein GCM10017600_48860 [Streptosporangium carneum]
MDRQPIVCNTCTGVLLTKDSRDYTPHRGRLIVTNGYCACPPAAAAVAEPAAQLQPQAEQQPVSETAMVNA